MSLIFCRCSSTPTAYPNSSYFCRSSCHHRPSRRESATRPLSSFALEALPVSSPTPIANLYLLLWRMDVPSTHLRHQGLTQVFLMGFCATTLLSNYEPLMRRVLAFAKCPVRCSDKGCLCCCCSKGEFRSTSHTTTRPSNTNQLVYRDLTFSASRATDRLVTHKMTVLDQPHLSQLYSIRNRLSRHDHPHQKQYCRVLSL